MISRQLGIPNGAAAQEGKRIRKRVPVGLTLEEIQMTILRRRLFIGVLFAVLGVAAILPAAAATTENFYPPSGSCTADGVGKAWTSGLLEAYSSSVYEDSCGTNVAARLSIYLGSGYWYEGSWVIELNWAYVSRGEFSSEYGFARGQLKTSSHGWGPVTSTGALYP